MNTPTAISLAILEVFALPFSALADGKSAVYVPVDKGTPAVPPTPEHKVPGEVYVPAKPGKPAVPPKSANETILKAQDELEQWNAGRKRHGTLTIG